MAFLDTLPIWAIGITIFLLRIGDVSLGTIRTIAVIQGRTRFAVTLGFFEVLIWVVAVAQVVSRLGSDPWIAPFYAGGYAAGVGVGMLIERRVSQGRFLIRIITASKAAEISEAVGRRGRVLATFPGQTATGSVNLIFISAIGNRVPAIVHDAKMVDSNLFYTVESAAAWSENAQPLAADGGWRAFMKRK
jgi:uncharacterized protein YebE (UPF0316 family)